MHKKETHNSILSSQYAHWLRTRKYYLKAPAMNLLARMQPYKSREAPNSFNWNFMQPYNAAVQTLAEQRDTQDAYAAWYLYWVIGAVTKDATRILKCGSRTYYDRIKRFEDRAASLAASLGKVIERNEAGLRARIAETLKLENTDSEATYG
jgi:hypothetical protein